MPVSNTSSPFVPAPVISSSADLTGLETSGVTPIATTSAGVAPSAAANEKSNAAGNSLPTAGSAIVNAIAQLTASAADVVDALPPAAPIQAAGSAVQTVASIIYGAAQNTQSRTSSGSHDGKALVQLALVFATLGVFVLLFKSESKPRSWTTLLFTPPA
jgi:hypothetical protein